MNHSESRISGSRIALIALILVSPLAGPGSFVVVLATVAALTAYEGLRPGTVYGILAALFCVELVYGLDVGILSLSYMAAVSVLSLVRRVMTVAPWSSVNGWNASDALRVLLVACGLFVVMASFGVIVGHFLYGYEDVRARLQMMFLTKSMAWTPIVIAVILIILRRIDEPFRRRITFST